MVRIFLCPYDGVIEQAQAFYFMAPYHAPGITRASKFQFVFMVRRLAALSLCLRQQPRAGLRRALQCCQMTATWPLCRQPSSCWASPSPPLAHISKVGNLPSTCGVLCGHICRHPCADVHLAQAGRSWEPEPPRNNGSALAHLSVVQRADVRAVHAGVGRATSSPASTSSAPAPAPPSTGPRQRNTQVSNCCRDPSRLCVTVTLGRHLRLGRC